MTFTLIQGDNRVVLKTLADNSIDAIITDPPYGIDFLGKAWDANTGALETYQECLRVLKPGGHILAFSAARTYHHLAVTLEQAGFEIRDQIMWIYSSGFPKSQDVGRQLHKKEHGKPDKQRYSKDEMTKEGDNYRHNTNKKLYRILPDINGDRLEKSHEGEGYGYIFEEIITIDNEWAGWGTALKPAHEPICLARKPMKGSIAKNVQQWGTGALNIDATRIPYEDQKDIDTYLNNKRGPMERGTDKDGENIRMFNGETGFKAVKREVTVEQDLPELGRFPSNVIGEIPDYQKYFYCPKVSRRERHMGFDLTKVPVIEFNDPGKIKEHPLWDASIGTNVQRLKEKIRLHNESCIPTDPSGKFDRTEGQKLNANERIENKQGNNHPTVKPVALMEYLIKLITPPGGTVLDPFNGSGSTGMAAVGLGFNYIGIDLDENYIAISRKRIEAWLKQDEPPVNPIFETLFE